MNCSSEAGNWNNPLQNIWAIIRDLVIKIMSDTQLVTKADLEKLEQLMGDYWEVTKDRFDEILGKSENRLMSEIKSYRTVVEKFSSLAERSLSACKDEIRDLKKEMKSLKDRVKSLEDRNANNGYEIKRKIQRLKKK